MPPIRIQGLTKDLQGRPARRRPRRPRDPRRRVHGARRPVGLRQVDAAADAGRDRRGQRRHDPHRRRSDVTRLDPRKRDIAMVFQSYALYPHLTVRGNLGFGLKLRGTDKAEIGRRVDDVARILGLDEVLERKPGELSGGQRQRVAMGRAIVREPQRVPDGRAALQPRREAARLDARAAQPAARAARRHDGLRHPRPGRGDDAGRPRRGAARRRAAAVRHAAGAVRAARRTCSSPRSSARRR